MKVTVSGQGMEVGSALRQRVEELLGKVVTKYFDRAINADVVFHKRGHFFSADIQVNEGTGNGIFIKGSGESEDVYAAFDQGCERIEKQLRRYKRRLKNHHKVKISEVDAEDVKALLQGKKYVISNDEASEDEGEGDTPLIIAEKTTRIEKLTVSEAVMRMNLADLPALMFINKKNGHINVVYVRKDGNISWVDSKVNAAAA
jgi:ribosomal subunit interface protein